MKANPKKYTETNTKLWRSFGTSIMLSGVEYSSVPNNRAYIFPLMLREDFSTIYVRFMPSLMPEQNEMICLAKYFKIKIYIKYYFDQI